MPRNTYEDPLRPAEKAYIVEAAKPVNQVACPTCKAPVGTRCVTQSGWATQSHRKRLEAADVKPPKTF